MQTDQVKSVGAPQCAGDLI